MTLVVLELPLWGAQRDSLRQPHFLHGFRALLRPLFAVAEFFLKYAPRQQAASGRTITRTSPGGIGETTRGAYTARSRLAPGSGHRWTTAYLAGEATTRAARGTAILRDGSATLPPLFSRPGRGVESPPHNPGTQLHETRNTCKRDAARNAGRHFGGRPVSRAAG